jgi:hypothetical protein
MPMISSSGSPDGTEALVSDLDAVVVGSERSHRLPVDVVDPAFTETLSRCNSAGPVPPADGACHGGAVAHELAIVALDGCMASAVADVLQVANGMVLRGGGSPVVSVRVATPSGGDATGFGRRTDPCRRIPGRAGQRGRGGAAAVQRRTGRLAGRAPRSGRVAEKPCRRGCSADVAQTPATNAATKAMVAAAQHAVCPDTWRRLGRRAHRRPCAPPPAPLWPFRADTGRST